MTEPATRLGHGRRPAVEVAVVSMPWNMHEVVSLQVAALKAYLQAEGVRAHGRHYHKDIVAQVDSKTISTVHEFGVGEHLFGACYFQDRRDEFAQLIEARSPLAGVDSLIERLDQFTHAVVDDLLSLDVGLIGFTTTHVQLVASLYSARLLKQERPDVRVVLGGLSLYGAYSNAILRHFPEIDFVVNGEGEIPLLLLARHLAGDGELTEIPRTVYRDADTGSIRETQQHGSLIDLEHSPLPDISDYFELPLFEDTPQLQPKVCVESARGCRWGRCTFCIEGIPSRGGYRDRSAARTTADVVALSSYAGTVDVVFTDPDMSRRRDVFDALVATDLDLRIDAEVSGLVDLPTLVSMQAAGLQSIQIGIESFAPRLLRKFAKGVQLIHYVELMRWCEMLGLDLVYNIIVGAPFETQGDVDLAVKNMARLFFLPPPIISEFVVSIGSEIHRSPEKFGITKLALLPEAIVYPGAVAKDLGPLLSFHAGYSPVTADPAGGVSHTQLVDAVREWWQYRERGATLTGMRGTDFVTIGYEVGDSIRTIVVNDPVEVAVLDACSIYAKTDKQLVAELHIEADRLAAAVRRLDDRDLIFQSDGRILTLPLLPRRFRRLISSNDFQTPQARRQSIPVTIEASG